MKVKNIRFFAIFLILVVICTIYTPVYAVNVGNGIQPMSSQYISSTSASISANSGVITVSFNIIATGTMTSVGATKVQIKDSGGNTVKTFYSSTTAGMMGYNRIIYSGSVSYSGTSGQKYYAVVSFKAANSSGSDTTSRTTGYVTA